MAFDALYIILPVAAAIFGAGGGVFVKNIYDKNSAESKVAKADEMVKKMITDAQKRAETLKKETILEAKEEVYRLKPRMRGKAKKGGANCSARSADFSKRRKVSTKSRMPLSSASSSLQSASRRSMQKKLPSASFMMHSSRNLNALRA